MAKRGRPSKKVIQKRKKVKSQSELYILFALLLLVAIIVAGYFTLFK